MRIKTNIGQVTGEIAKKLKLLKDKEYLLRPVAIGLIDKMTLRIHEEGKNSAGGQIGSYSSGYLKQRSAKRGTSSKVIISLTRQLENDWSVIATEKGYGIGFLNKHNLDKANWVQDGAEPHNVKAHKRTVVDSEGKAKTIDIKSHSNKGWAGYGRIFDLTEEEQAYAVDYINELVSNALNP